jgi:hypothetical protein
MLGLLLRCGVAYALLHFRISAAVAALSQSCHAAIFFCRSQAEKFLLPFLALRAESSDSILFQGQLLGQKNFVIAEFPVQLKHHFDRSKTLQPGFWPALGFQKAE